MKLRDKFPGKTRSRGLKGPVVAISLNSTSSKGSIILRCTLSEELLADMKTSIGERVDIDIEGNIMNIFRVPEGEGGWKIIPSGVNNEHAHGMIVPVLSLDIKPVKSDRAEIVETTEGSVKVIVPAGIYEGNGFVYCPPRRDS
jgi:hypothetical protein